MNEQTEENQLINNFLDALEQYIIRQLESDEPLVVEERNGETRTLGTHLELEFVNVQARDASACDRNTYFAPALVLAVNQEGKPVIYELDFYMTYDREEHTWNPGRISLQTLDEGDGSSPFNNPPVYLWNSERKNGRKQKKGSPETTKNGGVGDSTPSMERNHQNGRINDKPEDEHRLLIPIR